MNKSKWTVGKSEMKGDAMSIIKLFRKCIIYTILLFCFSGLCYAENEVVIHSYLMRVFREGGKSGINPDKATLATPINLQNQTKNEGIVRNSFDKLRDNVSKIYQVPTVIGLNSGTMIWDGKSESVNEAVFAYSDILFIQFYPHIINKNSISMRIESYKFRFNELHYFFSGYARLKREIQYGAFEIFSNTKKIENDIGGEKWLDKELTVPINEPIILALPTVDHSHFLAVRIFLKESRQFSVGLTDSKLEFFNVRDADPVCGRIIGRGDGFENRDKAEASLVWRGYAFLFCSQDCMKKFEKDPEGTLKRSKNKYFMRNPGVPNAYIPIQEIPSFRIEAPIYRPSLLVMPMLADTSREKGIQGVVRAEVRTDEAGNVAEVKILESLDLELDAAILAALNQWKFDPLLMNTAPASYRVDMDFKCSDNNRENEPRISAASSIKLGDILNKSADYCQRLNEAALNFICVERISESIFASKYFRPIILRRHLPRDRNERHPDPLLSISNDYNGDENEFVYDYQIIHKEGKLEERRILMQNTANAASTEWEPRRFVYSKPVFGPIGLLCRESQKSCVYSFLNEELLNGRPAWILEVKPMNIAGGLSYGKVWLDRQDGSVLKIDVAAESLGGYERVESDYESRGGKALISIELIYGIENGGLRYPSHMILEESYIDPDKGKIKMSKISVDYNRYKFFTVDTESKIIK